MIDLHIHSIYSDGSDDLEELFKNLRNANITKFALTDHDSAAGCRQVLKNEKLKDILKNIDLEMIVGSEWTALYGQQKMHILAYDFNPFDEKILKLEQEMQSMLKKKDEFRYVELKNKGYRLSQKSMDYLNNKENVRTLDFANCLVNDGYFNDVQVAASFLTKQIKYPKQCRFDAIYLLKILKEVGAKIVWAHPIYDVKREITSFEKVEEVIKELKPYGLTGLECYYSLYKKEEIKKLIDVAKRNNLIITCGSDYHGKNKKVMPGVFSEDNIDIDENIVFKNFSSI